MSKTSENYLFRTEVLSTLLLASYPTLMLIMKGGMNMVFILTLLLTSLMLVMPPKDLPKLVWQAEWTLYLCAMTGMTIAILLSQMANQKFGGHAHDAATRYWLAVPIFLVLQRMRLSIFSVLQYTFPTAAIVGFLLANNIIGSSSVDYGGRIGISTIDLIHFGDIELLLGFLSMLSLDWFTRDKLPLQALKVAGFAAGVFASVATGSRGGWMAVPVFIALILFFKTNSNSRRLVSSAVIAIFLAIVLLLGMSNNISQRLFEASHDVQSIGKGNMDTSTGIRLQLYKAATDVFVQHPIFGVGPQGFADEMQAMMEAEKITQLAAEMGRGEVHNDLLSKAAGMGIFGLFALLAIYAIPFYLFWKVRRSEVKIVVRAALMGAIFVTGHAVFGLTVEFLNLALATAFYSFTIAVLLALCYNVHNAQLASFKQDSINV